MMAIPAAVEASLERFYPVALGLVAGVLFALFGDDFFFYGHIHGWQLGVLYSSVFDLMAIATAFLFTFYTFFVTADRGFIGRLKGTETFKQVVRYTLGAIVLGAIVVVISIPMMLIAPKPIIFDARLVAVAIWVFFSVWALAAFVRAVYLFSIVASEHSS